MKPLLYIFFIFLSTVELSSQETYHQKSDNKGLEKALHLEFPIEPEFITEIVPIRGHDIELSMYVASNELDFYSLFELKLDELKQEVSEDVDDFFEGLLTFIINDIGAQLGTFSAFDFEGFKGYDYTILVPVESESWTAKGKALLVNNRVYVWFGLSNATDSDIKVSNFLNSYRLI